MLQIKDQIATKIVELALALEKQLSRGLYTCYAKDLIRFNSVIDNKYWTSEDREILFDYYTSHYSLDDIKYKWYRYEPFTKVLLDDEEFYKPNYQQTEHDLTGTSLVIQNTLGDVDIYLYDEEGRISDFTSTTVDTTITVYPTNITKGKVILYKK